MDNFFRPGRLYAVAGASTNTNKFGYKVFKWYVDRKLPVTPINFRKEAILGFESVEDIKEFQKSHPGNEEVSISVVTPPAVTKELLDGISSDLNGRVQALWFQPGTYNQEVLEQAKKVVPTVIRDCVLLHGDRHLSKI